MSIQGSRRGCQFAVAAVFLAGAPALCAPSTASDAHVLNRIFGDEYLTTNVREVCSRAAELAPEDRFEFLADWVLPREDHSTFRVVAEFSPTYPAPTSGNPETISRFREPSGGEIISPAVVLIDTAAALGRLDDLRRRIEAATAKSVEDRIARLALLALVDMAREDVPAAESDLNALFAVVAPDDAASLQLDPVLLCVHAAARCPELGLAIVDAAHRIVTSYQSNDPPSEWQRQFTAAYARVQAAAGRDDNGPAQPATPFAWWCLGSLPRARCRGAGYPVAQWGLAPGQADNLSSHDQDFLYFAVPLRGNFEVEGDVTGFSWRESQLLLGGKWVGPVYDRETYDLGNIGGSALRTRFTRPLAPVDAYLHERIVISDGTATTYVNGRAINDRRLGEDPWLAVRSAPQYDGGVRNVRIVGAAAVPDELLLSDPQSVSGWIPYYDEIVGVDWRCVVGSNGSGEIQGRRRTENLRGCCNESALFYHRPMLEDGHIEYEFWYDAGHCEAHPALDRLCFVLDRAGVHEHWLTDGKFDRTALPPDNSFDEPENRRGSSPLPLHDGDWNRLRLTVHGDTAQLVLNGKRVYERQLEPTNQRNFGLFHFADRTELRVRNVTWQGNWPREIPDVDSQELAVDETGFLDKRLPELSAVFAHDFGRDGLPLDRFAVMDVGRPDDVAATADGLLVTRRGPGGYLETTVAPALTVGGDFDITASFDQLVTDPREEGASGIMLIAIADNPLADESQLMRYQGGVQQVIQCQRVYRAVGQDRRHYFANHSMEAMSGKLRLARRGQTIYYLFAENDSRQFRLIGQEDFPADDLQLNGVRLAVQIHGDGGSTRVVWKNLSVRAERLSGPAVSFDDDRLFALNRERTSLAESVRLDLADMPPDGALVSRWTDLRPWNPVDGGLLIVAPGTDNWTSAGASLLRRIEGDFEISVRVAPRSFDLPAERRNSGVSLQVELSDGAATRLSLTFQKTSHGAMEAVAEVTAGNDPSVRNYRRVGRVGVASVRGLRLARRGRHIACTVLSDELGGERLIAWTDVGDAPIAAGNSQIYVHTGGAGRESQVVWTSLDVRADRMTPLQ